MFEKIFISNLKLWRIKMYLLFYIKEGCSAGSEKKKQKKDDPAA
jgi:hypothetical protein